MLKEVIFICCIECVIIQVVKELVDLKGHDSEYKAINNFSLLIKKIPKSSRDLLILVRESRLLSHDWNNRFGIDALVDCITVTFEFNYIQFMLIKFSNLLVVVILKVILLQSMKKVRNVRRRVNFFRLLLLLVDRRGRPNRRIFFHALLNLFSFLTFRFFCF